MQTEAHSPAEKPTSAVDASIRAKLLNLLERLRRRFNLTLLMISHDLRAVRHISERIAVMYLGHIVEIADAERLFASPAHPYTQMLITASMLDEIGLDAASRLISGERSLSDRKAAPPGGDRL